MTKPAFLVEGHLEQKFIQQTCPGAKVQKINCNGEHVSIECIAKRVGSLGRLIHKRFSPIIVLFDREGRTETTTQIEVNFRRALEPEGLEVPVIVGIPDRDAENWILSDFESFAQKARIERDLLPQSVEGQRGNNLIKKHLGNARSYVETIDGVTWLKACRPNVMMENSPSFKKFAVALANLSCHWLQEGFLPSANAPASDGERI